MLVDYVEKEKAAALIVSFRNLFHASDNDLQHADPSPLISLPPTPHTCFLSSLLLPKYMQPDTYFYAIGPNHFLSFPLKMGALE